MAKVTEEVKPNSAKKWMQALNKMEGAVDQEYDPFAPKNILRSSSPSLNWIFGKGSGIPFGRSCIFYGPAKAGKSLASYLMAGQLHQDNKEAIVVRFDTEMRSDPLEANNMWGIDTDRFIAFNTNKPTEIYDRIANELGDMLEQGMPLKMIIIDSMSSMDGLRRMEKSSISDATMGDEAMTHKLGLKRILPIIRKYKIALLCTAHIKANFDAGLYGPKVKMSGGYSEKHFFEYYVEVKRDNSADSKIEDKEGGTDFRGKKELIGHKIYVKMTESSQGVAGRTGEFTLDYNKGLINAAEEIAVLSKKYELIEMPNNRTYIVGDKKYTSKAQFFEALEEDKELADSLLTQIYDLNK